MISLSQAGVYHKADGTPVLDSSKLNSVLARNYSLVTSCKIDENLDRLFCELFSDL